MDLFSDLPLDLKRRVLRLLPPEDVWQCLTVSEVWRQAANDNILWENHCQKVGLDLFEADDDPEQRWNDLCMFANLWCPLYKWQHNEYQVMRFPLKNYVMSHFASYGSKFALIQDSRGSNFIRVISKQGTVTFDLIHSLKIHEVVMNSDFIVLRTLHGLVVYMNTVPPESYRQAHYQLWMVITAEDQPNRIHVLTDNFKKLPPSNNLYLVALRDEELYIRRSSNFKEIDNSVILINLITGEWESLHYEPEKGDYSMTKDYMVVSRSYQGVTVYRLPREEVTRVSDVHFCTIEVNNHLFVLFSIDHPHHRLQADTYKLLTGERLHRVRLPHGPHEYISWVVNHRLDLICGVHKTEEERILKAYSLQTGRLVWSVPLHSGCTALKIICNRYLMIETEFHEEWLLKELETGRAMYRGSGRVIHASNLFFCLDERRAFPLNHHISIRFFW